MISEFVKEKVFWTRKMNLKLVKFVENRPSIWNHKHSKYTNLDYKDRLYAQFASKYGNEFTGQAVKDRWTNIRSTYGSYLRKVKASQAKNEKPIYKVNWPLWDACSFLQKVYRKNKNLVSVEGSEKDIEDAQSSNDDNSSNEDTTCQNIANNILNIFKGVQNNVFDVDNEYSCLGNNINSTLSRLDSLEAAKLTNKITEILLLYHDDNPLNPNK